jgi:hypothetical protein
VAGATAAATAVRVTGIATLAVEPAVGDVIVAVGGVLTAVTVTGSEVPVFPFESVTFTDRVEFPATAGVNEAEYVATPATPGSVAIAVEPARN